MEMFIIFAFLIYSITIVSFLIIIRNIKNDSARINSLNDDTINDLNHRIRGLGSDVSIIRRANNSVDEANTKLKSRINELELSNANLESYVTRSQAKFGRFPDNKETNYPYEDKPTFPWSSK